MGSLLIKFGLILLCAWNIPTYAKDKKRGKCSLTKSMMPLCYHKRNTSELNVALLYYGDFWSLSDLERIEPILKERFEKAVSKGVKETHADRR